MKDLIGVKYSSHGRSLEEGFDCFGIVIEYFKRKEISINSSNFEKIDKLEKDCIVEISVYGEPKHCGIYLGEGQFLHTTPETGVCIVPMRLYKNRIKGIYRVIY